MKFAKYLSILAVVMCVPGTAVRALHFMKGFDYATSLPVADDMWLVSCIVLLAVCTVAYAVMALPLRQKREVRFEQLLGTQAVAFRMTAVIAGLLLCIGGGAYLYLTMTTVEQDAAAWARIVEIIYAVGAVAAGVGIIGMAKTQGEEMTSCSALLTLIPLFWSCIHLLVTYRMTCIDPNLPSFGFGLVGDVLIVLAFYHLARMLYGKPRPERMAFFSAAAVTLAVSDMAGYGIAWLVGDRVVEWSAKMVLRGGMSAVVCLFLAAELVILMRKSTEMKEKV